MKTINSLKISVPIMFERIGCNSDEYTKDLGEDFRSLKDIDEGNMINFLGVIEKRTNDLLQLYNEAYNTKVKYFFLIYFFSLIQNPRQNKLNSRANKLVFKPKKSDKKIQKINVIVFSKFPKIFQKNDFFVIFKKYINNFLVNSMNQDI